MILRGPARPDLLRDECLFDILQATARERPNHSALIWGERTVSYAELVSQSLRIAASLKNAGAIIGLCLPRGADLLIAQAGITASGAAWLPFDAETPVERIVTCLQAARACGLLTSQSCLPRFQNIPIPVWTIEELLASNPGEPVRLKPDEPAYVIYTSGSTGQPKGIVISHRSICHFLRSENELLGITSDDRVYQGFSVAFDMSFEEIWISYLTGATLWIAPSKLAGDPSLVADALAKHRITVMHAVPTMMGMLETVPSCIRLINLGGEACPDALVAKLADPNRKLFNTYGPTEATVSASLALLKPGLPVTIGTPLPNYGMMVVDDALQPMPADQPGELCIFGPGVALGYLSQPELTKQRFVDRPGAERYYRTGDLARIDSSGAVHFLGRVDDQVKIRGFRVELGEIESTITAQPGVTAAACVLKPIAGVEQLVAFVHGSGLNAAILRAALSTRFPPYMVPGRIEIVNSLPRLASGKIDRKTLATQPLTIDSATSAQPRNDEEAALYAALGKLFPGVPLQPQSDFFSDLGGHSLLTARLVSLLRNHAQYTSLSIQDVYRGRTLEAIAERMREAGCSNHPAPLAERRAVPRLRRVVCGIAQALVIPPLMLLHIVAWLLPFFVYHYSTGDETDSLPLAVLISVATFTVSHVGTFWIAIAGKWLIVGRLKAGRYPLWGRTYFRWWLADQLCNLPPTYLLSGTPFLNWYLRAMGSSIGPNAFLDSMLIRAPDLLTIETGASVGTSVRIANARVERGTLVLGPVHLGRESAVDSFVVLEEHTTVGAGSRLNGLSALSAGNSVPDGQTWEGSPARSVNQMSEPLPPRPVIRPFQWLAQLAFFAVATQSVAILFFMPVFPAFMLIDWIDANYLNVAETQTHIGVAFGLYFLVGIPASMVLVLATALTASALRRLFLRRVQAGLWSVYSAAYCRKWLISRLLDTSLGVLHSLYATTFAPLWLRLMGAHVGSHAEVSTAEGIVPDLLTLGDDTFIADGVLLGDEEQRGGWMVLRPTVIGNRTFVGNGAYVADGAILPDDVLIGVQTRTPENSQLKPGQTWMGSPPVQLPARETLSGYPESLTFRPSNSRRIGRAFVESLRIVLPLAFIIASGYLIVQVIMPVAEQEHWGRVVAMLALVGCIYGLGCFLFVFALKWLLIGRYRPRTAPMWTPFVWLSEAVTNVYEALAVPNLLEFLRGTPMLPWAMRLLGVRIGRDTYLDTTDFTEFDCVSIGDAAELNAWSGPQTHLFEDRVMKIGRIEIGKEVTVGAGSTILYDTQIGDSVQLGPLTLVAKGERFPTATRWHGSPAVPVN